MFYYMSSYMGLNLLNHMNFLNWQLIPIDIEYLVTIVTMSFCLSLYIIYLFMLPNSYFAYGVITLTLSSLLCLAFYYYFGVDFSSYLHMIFNSVLNNTYNNLSMDCDELFWVDWLILLTL